MDRREYYVYIMTTKNNTVLYIGVTNDIYRRVHEHKQKSAKGFTSKYNVVKLIYFEEYEYIHDALDREKQLKKWYRKWKEELINKFNPDWEDLSKHL
ncbi:GIY-YIG nuclease family protein [Patescibacteria group bacterium]|nr:GIY-YIG nuclease family protein [Patescibacteria group bacterium]